jgi:hypothetical protein
MTLRSARVWFLVLFRCFKFSPKSLRLPYEKTFKIGPTNKPTKRSSNFNGTEILATRDTQVRESNRTEFPPRGPFQIASFGTERPGGVQTTTRNMKPADDAVRSSTRNGI